MPFPFKWTLFFPVDVATPSVCILNHIMPKNICIQVTFYFSPFGLTKLHRGFGIHEEDILNSKANLNVFNEIQTLNVMSLSIMGIN